LDSNQEVVVEGGEDESVEAAGQETLLEKVHSKHPLSTQKRDQQPLSAPRKFWTTRYHSKPWKNDKRWSTTIDGKTIGGIYQPGFSWLPVGK